jgi:hypothetical protein
MLSMMTESVVPPKKGSANVKPSPTGAKLAEADCACALIRASAALPAVFGVAPVTACRALAAFAAFAPDLDCEATGGDCPHAAGRNASSEASTRTAGKVARATRTRAWAWRRKRACTGSIWNSSEETPDFDRIGVECRRTGQEDRCD